ncbi:MAG: enoyl-CoA hydratase/isomerase family protein [Comamonadaceae bacterium]|nr:enoyl-CoA hydratase/isomerase family protein [Comamonadaceae bacterium]
MAQTTTNTSALTWKQEGHVALVTISNPSARNALTRTIFDQGLELFRSFRRNPDIRAIVLCGDGAHFSGGGSLTRMQEQRGKPKHLQAEHVDQCHAWILAMRECPQPIIAAVEGAAAGGGMALAMACDLMVAAEDAKMLMSHTRIGLSPDCGATHWLSRALPHQLALELMLDPSSLPVARLQQLGIVNRIAEKGQAISDAMAWAAVLAQGPAAAFGRVKTLTYAAEHRSLSDQMDAERDFVVESIYGDECGEGIHAFLEKRPARFDVNALTVAG